MEDSLVLACAQKMQTEVDCMIFGGGEVLEESREKLLPLFRQLDSLTGQLCIPTLTFTKRERDEPTTQSG